MAPKRRREDTNDDEDQESITWISQRLYTGTLILLSIVACPLNSACRLERQKTIGTRPPQ